MQIVLDLGAGVLLDFVGHWHEYQISNMFYEHNVKVTRELYDLYCLF